VAGFLAGHKEMGLLNLGDEIPVWGRDLIDPQGFFRSYPHVHNMDGFFGAAFVKEGGAGGPRGRNVMIRSRHPRRAAERYEV
jgi:hypothetical protein